MTMTTDTMKGKTRKLLTELKTVLERRVGLHSLILFGSRARGDFEAYSDMDVLVVVDELNADTEKTVRDFAWEIGLANGVVIVPVIYSRDEWENGPDRSSLLALAIEKEGVPV